MSKTFKYTIDHKGKIILTCYGKQISDKHVVLVDTDCRIISLSYDLRKEIPDRSYQDIAHEEFEAAFNKAAERILAI